MKKSLKIALIVFAVVLGVALLIGASLKLIEIDKERKAEKLETSEVIYVRLDEAPQSFSSTKDSLAWALSVDEEIMLRYFSDLNPDKYHLKADSIAALLKSENLETSLLVLEKSRGVEKTAEFVYDQYRFDYDQNYKLLDHMSTQDAVEAISLNVDNWIPKRRSLFGELNRAYLKNLRDELYKLGEATNDILWLLPGNYLTRFDLLDSLYSSIDCHESVAILVVYSCHGYHASNPSTIIDKINTKKLSEDYRLGKLLSPKRYEEVVTYLKGVGRIRVFGYLLNTGASKEKFFKTLMEYAPTMNADEIAYLAEGDRITVSQARDIVKRMSFYQLINLPMMGPEDIAEVTGIKNYEVLVINSIKNRDQIFAAEIFFNNHSDLYGDRKFLYKALEEKWDSFK